MKHWIFIFLLVSSFSSLFAQVKSPAPSPICTLSQKVGLTDVSIMYSRPGVKDRVIFGELVPFGEMWRTGANASTKLKFSEDVMLNDIKIEAGEYALYTTPGQNEWTVVIYSNTSFWGTPGDEYKEEEIAAKFAVKPVKLNSKVETMTFDINDIRNESATINLLWENTKVSIPLKVDTDSKVLATIEETMSGPSGRDYYLAARYYHETGKDANQAYEWVNKAIDLDGDRYWLYRLKALIEAELGKYGTAILSAEQSMSLAKDSGNMNMVRMNEESIEDWRNK